MAGLGISGFVIAFATRGVFFRSLIYLLEFSNSLCIVLCCVFGFVALSRASALALFCRPCFGWSVASRVVFCCSFRGAAGLLSFAAAVRFCGWLPSLFVCFSVCLGCVRFGSLFQVSYLCFGSPAT